MASDFDLVTETQNCEPTFLPNSPHVVACRERVVQSNSGPRRSQVRIGAIVYFFGFRQGGILKS